MYLCLDEGAILEISIFQHFHFYMLVDNGNTEEWNLLGCYTVWLL
jgi:hypothetical protein